MFALLITEENLDKILQSVSTHTASQLSLGTYIRHSRDWYFVTGYIPYIGAPVDWGVLPQYILDDKYEYDPDKIKTDWDQIVRK